MTVPRRTNEPERAAGQVAGPESRGADRPPRPGEHGHPAPALELRRVCMNYRRGQGASSVLHSVNLTLMPGDFVALTGPSGSGKTTLLKLMAGLEQPNSGAVIVAGTDLRSLAEEALARLRLRGVAVVFQQHQLIATLSALENVALPLLLRGVRRSHALSRGEEMLAELGYTGSPQQLPEELSLGERQRLAIARALVSEAPVLLADEPTASLDSVAGDAVMRSLRRLGSERGRTVVLATHDARAAAHADRSYRLQCGALEAT